MGQVLSGLSSDGPRNASELSTTTTTTTITGQAPSVPVTNTASDQQITNQGVGNDLSGSSNYLNDLLNNTNSPGAIGQIGSNGTAAGSAEAAARPTSTTTFQTNEEEFSVNIFGTVLYPLRWLTLTTFTSWLGPLSSLAMIIGCVLPYAPQYATIHKTRSCSGFSTFVCLTLLLANILRIAFWFGHRFELPLLIQSVVMILAQLLLLELCVRVKRQHGALTRRIILSTNPRNFWRWTDLTSYLIFLTIIVAILGAATYYFIDNGPFIEALGYCSLVTESMLGLPQVIRNYRKRSVVGMSLSMVLMWLAGDTFKTGYFIANAVPYQFWLCGLLQITIDIIILFQVCLFKHSAPLKADRNGKSPTREMVPL